VTVDATTHPAKTRVVAHAAGSDTIRDFQFSPSTITVTAGESVTWSNSGPSVHSATADDGSFDTGILNKGQSGSHTFTRPGTYAFHCTPHPFMTGKVIVTAAGGGGGGSASSSGSGSASGASSSGASAATPGSTTGSATSSGSGLPNTGADTGAVALLGAILLGGGIVLRRRVEDER
jgi:LPXTG-motif cell wall-anchored protein